MPPANPPPALSHVRRVLCEPDDFGEAVSGIDLSVDFQRRQERASSVEQFQSAAFALDVGEAHAATRVRGTLAGQWASLCIVLGPGHSTWNAQAAPPGTLACLPPGAELDGRTAPGFSWVTLAVAPDGWRRAQLLAGGAEERLQSLTTHALPPLLRSSIEARLRQVHRQLQASNHQSAVAADTMRQAAEFTLDCFTTAWELAAVSRPARDSRRNRSRLARRADAWMRDHLGEAVQVPDVCLALRVSRRELEYAFRAVFEQSPRDYLQALRLNSIRRALRRSGAPITEVALNHGVTHLGRFAAQYRALFGERPSETQRGNDVSR